MGKRYSRFTVAIDTAIEEVISGGEDVDPGRWQGMPTEGKPDLMTKEIMNYQFEVPTMRPSWSENYFDWTVEMAQEIRPNLPWAETHFLERIGGVPHNPDPSHTDWPWWHGQDDATKDEGKFTHTYSERFWPTVDGYASGPNPKGIRFRFGDYNDLLDLLAREPNTRQAWLPIFFPEDTGAVHGGRIPCTLGYHFLRRDGYLHMWYVIRSCDVVRHFRDDVFLAVRLLGHTLDQLADREILSGDNTWLRTKPGIFYFTAFSFHLHKGDLHNVQTY